MSGITVLLYTQALVKSALKTNDLKRDCLKKCIFSEFSVHLRPVSHQISNLKGMYLYYFTYHQILPSQRSQFFCLHFSTSKV